LFFTKRASTERRDKLESPMAKTPVDLQSLAPTPHTPAVIASEAKQSSPEAPHARRSQFWIASASAPRATADKPSRLAPA
jgi:hypothetical protein